MLLGRDHLGDGERRQRLRLVLDVLDLEPDHGELVGELFDRLVGVEMLLQPGEGEFHGSNDLTASAIVERLPQLKAESFRNSRFSSPEELQRVVAYARRDPACLY